MNGMKRSKKNRYLRESLFCLAMVGFFILHWIVFWVIGNINSIRLAFTYYNASEGEQVLYPFNQLLTNFKDFFTDITTSGKGKYLLNGLYFQVLSSLVCLPLGYMVSFIIYKKMKGSEFFKAVLYLPSILSGLVTGMLYQHFLESGLSGFFQETLHKTFPYVFTDTRYVRLTISTYMLYIGFPAGLLINLGTMSRIPKDLVEYGELEGLSLWQEFLYLTLPLVYPVLEVQCLGIFVNIFNNMGPLYIFYGGGAPEEMQSFGYFMFTAVFGGRDGRSPNYMYGYTSAANLMIGLMSIPIVQGTKWLFDKFDPEAEF